jgi:hypothetical protein
MDRKLEPVFLVEKTYIIPEGFNNKVGSGVELVCHFIRELLKKGHHLVETPRVEFISPSKKGTPRAKISAYVYSFCGGLDYTKAYRRKLRFGDGYHAATDSQVKYGVLLLNDEDEHYYYGDTSSHLGVRVRKTNCYELPQREPA